MKTVILLVVMERRKTKIKPKQVKIGNKPNLAHHENLFYGINEFIII